MRGKLLLVVAFVACSAITIYLASCGSGSSPASMQAATVNVTISDPATCQAPQGPFSHIFVTITDALIHQSSTAGANDPGWVDLTPSLKNAPMQIDLLGQANNQCFLATLGSTTAIQPGTFQQIRIILADNTVRFEGNKCGGAANCVMLASDVNQTPHTLLLSSESQTGIKIPSGQLAGGQFTVAAGQVKDLNIDFNACASVVQLGNGSFRLKPVLHAGEVSLTSSTITGTVIDSVTKQAIVGGNAVVALEQKDGNNVDRVIMETVAANNGNFIFCPVTAGTYDVVITAINGAGTAYGATVITGVQPGNSLGNVLIVSAALPASLKGQITTSTGSAATVADIQLSALQPITVNNVTIDITVPLPQFPAATATLTTAPGTCPANTDCVNYTLSVPAMNPGVAAFSTGGTQTPGAPAAGPINYTMDALAFVPGQASTPDCTQPHMQTSQTTTNSPLIATAGTQSLPATLAFSGCQ